MTPNEAFFLFGMFVGGICVAVGYRIQRRWWGMQDWQEGYEACKRDWDDWERARNRNECKP